MRSEITSLVIVCCFAVIIQSRRSFLIKLRNIECTANPDIVNLTECSMREYNSVPTIFLDAIVLRHVSTFNLALEVIMHREQRDLVLFNVKRMDGCMFLSNALKFPLVEIVRKELEKYSNLPTKCPVESGTSVNVRGLRVNPDNFPTYALEGKFSSIGYLYTEAASIINMTITGVCEPKRKLLKIYISRN